VLGMSPEAQRIKCRIGRSDVWNAKSLEMALVDKAPALSLVTGAMSVSHMHSSLFSIRSSKIFRNKKLQSKSLGSLCALGLCRCSVLRHDTCIEIQVKARTQQSFSCREAGSLLQI
jgi:hypothetical protein